MALAPGMRLGGYDIEALIGAGGMGEVYRATDTRLKRQVAVKSLTASLSSDPERLARFRREAELLAALNHPNIAHVYGLETAGDSIALVMELVDGPTLAERIAGGPLPLDEALALARQVVDAVATAHDQGIVHRDLKPANIKLRSDGVVKVLDFGLAKAAPVATVGAAASVSPTLTSPAFTQAGMILGTAAYMAPEQARGRAVDTRADIWAFGCVLFEMVTGRRAFGGDDITETLASIVKDQPDLDAAPVEVRRLLRKCLEKDPNHRLRDIGDAWELLETGRESVRAAPVARASIAWSVAAAFAVAAAYFALGARRVIAPLGPTHLFVQLPGETPPLFFAMSPDGRQVAINPGGRLEIRSLDTGELRTVNGVQTPRSPFWSPDSRTIGYFSLIDRKLATIPAAGGVPHTLCDNVDPSGAATWNVDGTILFSQRGSLMRTSAAGGSCDAITSPDAGVVRAYPIFLPDGDHFLYVQSAPDEARTGVFVSSLRSGAPTRLLADRSGALFAPDAPGAAGGRLLFVRDQTLMAARFDAAALMVRSDPVVVADHVSVNANGMIAVSVDAAGTLMYLRNGRRERQLAWVDRTGAPIGRPIPNGTSVAAASLSPDGRRTAFVRESSGRAQVSLHDWQTNRDVVFRNEPAAVVWSADGQRLAFAVAGAGIFVKHAGGGAEEPILRTDRPLAISDWTRDGRWMLYTQTDPRTGPDIWLLPVPAAPGDRPTPVPLLRTTAVETQAQVSPDGKWLAYVSDESGTAQVFVRPFAGTSPLPDTKWQVSSVFGREPRWRGDSGELYYLETATAAAVRNRVMAVPIHAGTVGVPQPLFDLNSMTIVPSNNVFIYAPAQDGQRFLVDMFASDVQPTLDVILNSGAGSR